MDLRVTRGCSARCGALLDRRPERRRSDARSGTPRSPAAVRLPSKGHDRSRTAALGVAGRPSLRPRPGSGAPNTRKQPSQRAHRWRDGQRAEREPTRRSVVTASPDCGCHHRTPASNARLHELGPWPGVPSSHARAGGHFVQGKVPLEVGTASTACGLLVGAGSVRAHNPHPNWPQVNNLTEPMESILHDGYEDEELAHMPATGGRTIP